MKLTKEDLLLAAEAAELWPHPDLGTFWTTDDRYDSVSRPSGKPGIG